MVDVLVAATVYRIPNGLKFIPDLGDVYVNTELGWARAANRLLEEAAARGRDVVFMDDDVTLYPETFRDLARYYERAEVFGFTLKDGDTVVSAGFEHQDDGTLKPSEVWRATEPGYVAHVTSSLIYLKAAVVREDIRFPVWEDGLHWEDVAFTYNCLLHGFRILHIPGVAGHPAITAKMQLAEFKEKSDRNKKRLELWMREHHVAHADKYGGIPHGRRQGVL